MTGPSEYTASPVTTSTAMSAQGCAPTRSSPPKHRHATTSIQQQDRLPSQAVRERASEERTHHAADHHNGQQPAQLHLIHLEGLGQIEGHIQRRDAEPPSSGPNHVGQQQQHGIALVQERPEFRAHLGPRRAVTRLGTVVVQEDHEHRAHDGTDKTKQGEGTPPPKGRHEESPEHRHGHGAEVGARGIHGKPQATPLRRETLGDEGVPNRMLRGVSNTREEPPGQQAPKGLRQRRADHRQALADVPNAEEACVRIRASQDAEPQL